MNTRPIARAVLLAALLAITVFGAACKSEGKAQDFEIITYQSGGVLNTQTLRFQQLLKDKPIVLNFWAGLCGPCRKEMPDFEAAAKKYQGQVVIVGVDVGPFTGLGSREEGRNLLKELGVTYPAGTTGDRTVTAKYNVLGMPTTVFIKPDGTIVRRFLGDLDAEDIEQYIQELLKKS